jgi:hypothetical protein
MFAAIPGVAALSNIAATGLPFVQTAAQAVPTYLTAAAQANAPWALPFLQPGAAAAAGGATTGAATTGAAATGAATTAGAGAGAGSTAAAGAGMGAAGSAACVVGAGLAGLAAGTGLGALVDEYGKGGMFGTNEWGQERSAFDWASDKGHGVSDFLGGGTLGDVGGAITAGALSIPAALYGGVAQTGANAVSSLFSYLTD